LGISAKEDKMEERKLRIQGMSCEHCVRMVKKALEGLPGVLKAQVSLEGGEAAVHLSPEGVSAEQLIRAVEEAGYQAEVLS
jgi:copper chaperone